MSQFRFASRRYEKKVEPFPLHLKRKLFRKQEAQYTISLIRYVYLWIAAMPAFGHIMRPKQHCY
ncbi:MAG: hypothetical protein A3I66_20170 [Burkholderiales bacterium RIFCSPLOWO2_02_FULL_57_36]|nr:MAG: hypothetical protein A3I66_20170 [Burkholderiales bacterium RIFCSPLOWO2_02_FULL_57_36]